jgi:hypothetical protein
MIKNAASFGRRRFCVWRTRAVSSDVNADDVTLPKPPSVAGDGPEHLSHLSDRQHAAGGDLGAELIDELPCLVRHERIPPP